jgi:hypothetical protein
MCLKTLSSVWFGITLAMRGLYTALREVKQVFSTASFYYTGLLLALKTITKDKK